MLVIGWGLRPWRESQTVVCSFPSRHPSVASYGAPASVWVSAQERNPNTGARARGRGPLLIYKGTQRLAAKIMSTCPGVTAHGAETPACARHVVAKYRGTPGLTAPRSDFCAGSLRGAKQPCPSRSMPAMESSTPRHLHQRARPRGGRLETPFGVRRQLRTGLASSTAS